MNRANTSRRPQRVAVAGFVLATAGAVGFATAYVVDADIRWQGAALAVAFLGLALGLASWAVMLPPGPYVEKREPMESPAEDSAVLTLELDTADGWIRVAAWPRRWFTLALGALGLALLFPLRSLLGTAPTPSQTKASSAWSDGVRVVRHDGSVIRPEELALGTALTVFPQGHTTEGDVAVLLLRVEESKLQLPPARMDWTVAGIVGYSKICTHAGCPVGLYAEGSGQLLCPCHQSVFDIYRLAEPQYGPAARPLPQLPLGLAADGTLIARGDFPTPPGPGYWRRS